MTHSYNLLNEGTVLMNCVLSPLSFPLSLTSSPTLYLLSTPLHLLLHSFSSPPLLLSLSAGCWWRAIRMTAGTVVITGGILATVILLLIIAVLCYCRLQVRLFTVSTFPEYSTGLVVFVFNSNYSNCAWYVQDSNLESICQRWNCTGV